MTGVFGVPYYGTTWGDMPFSREMGESYEDMQKAAEFQKAQREKAAAEKDTYRPREMGEDPASVTSRPQQGGYTTAPSRPTRETRPREMGETPEDVARAEKKDSRYKSWDEMTEQERVIDMYA